MLEKLGPLLHKRLPKASSESQGSTQSSTEVKHSFWDCCQNCKVPLPLGQQTKRKGPVNPCSLSKRLNTLQLARNSRSKASEVFLPPILSHVNISMELKTVKDGMKNMASGQKKFQSNYPSSLRFLHAISSCCLAAQKSSWEKVGIPYTKARLASAVAVILEAYQEDFTPPGILSCSMLSIYHLSEYQPPLNRSIEGYLLRLVLHGVFTAEMESVDFSTEGFSKSSIMDTLGLMLRGLLVGDPTLSHLLFLLKHINFWMLSKHSRERERALRCGASLLRFASRLAELDVSGDHRKLGYFVAVFGLHITAKNDQLGTLAREAIHCLKKLLFLQRGLRMNYKEDPWRRTEKGKNELSAYKDTCLVGEVFRDIFTEDQQRAFLNVSLLAVHGSHHRLSVAGLLLVYSVLGKSGEVLGEEAKVVKRKVLQQVHSLKKQKKIPEALEDLFSFKD